jgi:hypothetical protein
MGSFLLRKVRWAAALGALALPLSASAWELAGTKTISLHSQDGQAIPIGTVTFRPEGRRTAFVISLDHARFKDFFLSMKEFKCLEGPEVMCHVPYPHRNPGTVTVDDLAWLEHSLLFLHKSQAEFGAKLWNGLYYRMAITEAGIVGTAQAVDLNLIGAPPADSTIPPYPPADRSDIDPASRWLGRLTIR